MRVRWSPSELEAIKRLAVTAALRSGAADVRVASASRDPQTHAALRAAFARGDFETWPYDDEYVRKAASPVEILPGARAVLCVAVPYRRPAPSQDLLTGRTSSYAWSSDYHRRIATLLRRVAAVIDEAAGEPVTVIACDTKPLAERALAARSGLAWIGKHTNAIHPRFGSFVFLGEIVTSLALPLDAPLRKSCGSCTRCLPACPTGALRGDYTIDATRCISDLTQRTGPIPREMRSLIGCWVWGCDLCQEACPPNRNAPYAASQAHAPLAPETATPSLVRLLRLRASEFKKVYSRTAMGWRGAAVLRRNAAVALGNCGDRSAVPALAEALRTDPHPLVRGHAAWALGRIGSPSAIGALAAAAKGESDASVREELRSALEPYGGAPALHPT